MSVIVEEPKKQDNCDAEYNTATFISNLKVEVFYTSVLFYYGLFTHKLIYSKNKLINSAKI